MPTITQHAPGSFCWVELATTDPVAAKQFYGELFGWAPLEFDMGDSGTYCIFQLGGRHSAATLATLSRTGAPRGPGPRPFAGAL